MSVRIMTSATGLTKKHGAHADMEAGESMQPGLRLQAAQSAHSSPATRLPGSILKGLAPRALIASPEGSPRAGDEPEDWNTLAEVRGRVLLMLTGMLQHITASFVMQQADDGSHLGSYSRQ